MTQTLLFNQIVRKDGKLSSPLQDCYTFTETLPLYFDVLLVEIQNLNKATGSVEVLSGFFSLLPQELGLS